MKTQVQKSIRFPAKAVAIIESDVQNKLGIDFNKYLQTIVINKAEEIQRGNTLTPAVLAEIEESERAIAEGKDKLLKTKEDIKEYFAALLAEDE